jgi:Ca2+-binding EF-hand superfamily protein
VQKLVHLVPALTEEELFKTCRVLDVDGSGTISLDEFLEFFGHLKSDEEDTKKAEEEL